MSLIVNHTVQYNTSASGSQDGGNNQALRNWQPDVELDLASAATIVAAQFPSFAHADPCELGRGWDNLCIEYPDETVFRFPTRRMGAEIASNEMAALPDLSTRVPLPIPVPTHFGDPIGDYPYRFFGYLKIPGDPLQIGGVENAERLGEFLAVLHAIDPAKPPYASLPGDTLKRADRLMEKIDLRGGQIIAEWPDRADWARDLMRRAEAELAGYSPSATARVVHGDLYARHVLAKDDRISGVIDWGDIHLGSADIDLSIAFSAFCGADRRAFWHAYGALPRQEGLARARAMMYALAMVAYGMDVDDSNAVHLGYRIADNATAG